MSRERGPQQEALLREEACHILGVSQTASKEEIKKAYRTLVRALHPDVVKETEESNRRIRAVNKAYEFLEKHPPSSPAVERPVHTEKPPHEEPPPPPAARKRAPPGEHQFFRPKTHTQENDSFHIPDWTKDVKAFDHFNYPPGETENTQRCFAETFSGLHTLLKERGAPFFVENAVVAHILENVDALRTGHATLESLAVHIADPKSDAFKITVTYRPKPSSGLPDRTHRVVLSMGKETIDRYAFQGETEKGVEDRPLWAHHILTRFFTEKDRRGASDGVRYEPKADMLFFTEKNLPVAIMPLSASRTSPSPIRTDLHRIEIRSLFTPGEQAYIRDGGSLETLFSWMEKEEVLMNHTANLAESIEQVKPRMQTAVRNPEHTEKILDNLTQTLQEKGASAQETLVAHLIQAQAQEAAKQFREKERKEPVGFWGTLFGRTSVDQTNLETALLTQAQNHLAEIEVERGYIITGFYVLAKPKPSKTKIIEITLETFVSLNLPAIAFTDPRPDRARRGEVFYTSRPTKQQKRQEHRLRVEI